jgi:outer membrane PBP1 activator LpoA protein
MQKIFIGLITLLLSACSFNTLSTQSTESARLPISSAPKNVTLFVPLEGANASSGQAVRNGFLAAYYYAKQNGANAPTITVVDTNSEGGNIIALYQEAVSKGADFIVGPLTKRDVQTLTHQDHLSVPVLALNTIDNTTVTPNLYQFGLLPKDEVVQVAVRAKHDGFSRAVIMTPVGNWGSEMASAFEEKWRTQGGEIVDRLTYAPRENMTAVVQKVFKNSTRPEVIFLVATPMDARQIKPLLTFYGSRSLPVYATSSVYTGNPSGEDHDLEGIIFADMPWTIGDDTPALHQIRSNIQTLWPESYARAPRLYALGIDAYHLTYAFSQLLSGVAGATGTLTLDANQRIHRTLEWATFKAGKPQH